MNQLIYSPFNALSLPRFSRLFDNSYSNESVPTRANNTNWVPAVDIRELQDSFNVLIDIPGVALADVDITVDKGILTIQGTRSSESNSEVQGFKRLERSTGTFLRSFTLPETADGEHIKARVDNGVLEVSIPKSEKSKPLTISIES